MATDTAVLFDRSTMETGPVVSEGSINGVLWLRCATTPQRQGPTPWRRCAQPEESFIFVKSAIER